MPRYLVLPTAHVSQREEIDYLLPRRLHMHAAAPNTGVGWDFLCPPRTSPQAHKSTKGGELHTHVRPVHVRCLLEKEKHRPHGDFVSFAGQKSDGSVPDGDQRRCG
jgi:hypothetical protein